MNPLLLFKLFPLHDWLYFAAAVALAGTVGVGAHKWNKHEQAIGAAPYIVENVRRAAQAQDATASAAIETTRRESAKKDSDHEADKFRAQSLADAHAVPAAADRLLQRFAATPGCGVPRDPSAVAASPPASAPADLRADVLRRVVEAAGQLAAAADDFHGPGAASERQYDSLKGSPK